MYTSRCLTPWVPAMRLFPCVLVISLTLGLGLSCSIGSLFAQPTLKEVLEQSSPEEEEKESPAETPPQAAAPSAPTVETKPAPVKKKIPSDELNRGVPRTSIKGFLNSAHEREFEKAAQYLDLRNLPANIKKLPGAELARQLYIVLTRSLLIDYDLLSMDPKGHLDDDLPEYRDPLVKIATPDKSYNLLLQKVPREDGKFVWKISNRTVRDIPELYEIFGHGWLDDVFPHWFFDYQIFEIHVWEWVGIALAMMASYLVVQLVTMPILFFFRRGKSGLARQLIENFHAPVRFLLWAVFARHLVLLMSPSLLLQAVAATKTIPIIALAWFLLKLVDFCASQMADGFKQRGRQGLVVFVPAVGNIIKVLVIIILFVSWLDNIGVRVTTLVAGLGIGGLAVALAAQKSLENFIGAITLYSSRPVKVGDFCRFGQSVGTVEEIGLRSTRIRSLDRTLISLPNADFSNMQLENLSKRDKIRYYPNLKLRQDTTPDQLRFILVEIRTLLYAHPKVLDDPAKVRFVGFGEYSLNIEVFAYVDVTNWNEFQEVAEDLNLRIMDVVKRAGSGIAQPAQTIHVRRGEGKDLEQTRTAEDQVRNWRKNNALYIPSFPQNKIEELRASLDYPPVGSPEAAAQP